MAERCDGCGMFPEDGLCDCYDAPAPQADAAPATDCYVCPAGCGCKWRDNGDGTMSLFDAGQKSCPVCEPLPLRSLIPCWSDPPAPQADAAGEARKGDHIHDLPGLVVCNPDWPNGSEPYAEACPVGDCQECERLRQEADDAAGEGTSVRRTRILYGRTAICGACGKRDIPVVDGWAEHVCTDPGVLNIPPSPAPPDRPGDGGEGEVLFSGRLGRNGEVRLVWFNETGWTWVRANDLFRANATEREPDLARALAAERQRADAAEREVERLRGLAERAYREGYLAHQTHGDTYRFRGHWKGSQTRAALRGEGGEG